MSLGGDCKSDDMGKRSRRKRRMVRMTTTTVTMKARVNGVVKAGRADRKTQFGLEIGSEQSA